METKCDSAPGLTDLTDSPCACGASLSSFSLSSLSAVELYAINRAWPCGLSRHPRILSSVMGPSLADHKPSHRVSSCAFDLSAPHGAKASAEHTSSTHSSFLSSTGMFTRSVRCWMKTSCKAWSLEWSACWRKLMREWQSRGCWQVKRERRQDRTAALSGGVESPGIFPFTCSEYRKASCSSYGRYKAK